MSSVQFPNGYRVERLARSHPRKAFASGKPQVDDWLKTKAFQNQEKHLSVTRVLLDASNAIVGYYTIATSEVEFGDLPLDLAKSLPRRRLPVAILAWLGVARACQGQGVGGRLLSSALADCYDAGQLFAFVAVILDCLDDAAKAFYSHYDFAELPNHPYRLFLSADRLSELMTTS